jgi:hypothetical protein
MADGKAWARNTRRFHAIEDADRTLARWSKVEDEQRLRYIEAHELMVTERELWQAAITLRAWALAEASRVRFAYDHRGLGGRPYSDDYTDEELGI